MYNWTGVYKKTNSSQELDAEVWIDNGSVSISFPDDNESEILHWPLADLDVRYVANMDVTFIRPFPGEPSCVIIPGKNAFEKLSALPVNRHQPKNSNDNRRGWTRLLVFVAVVIALMIALYFLLVPYAAEKIAGRVSVDTERDFGESIYNGLALGSQVDAGKSALANQFFTGMHVTTKYQIRFSVVNSPVVNAFALPGGRIVIYTGLLDKMKTYPELAALMGHEFTHVDFKHSTKSVFRRLGSKVFISLVLGRNGAVAGVLADQADELKSLSYSRSLEKEADLNGLAMMRTNGIDPAGFNGLFTSLKDGNSGSATPGILASHPDLDERIRYVREAAGGYEIKTDSTLAPIFARLKNTSTRGAW